MIRQFVTSGVGVIAGSFALALLLMAVQLPRELSWVRADWVCLVLIYWVIALPQRIGVVVSFTVGLLLDVLEGAALGHHALSLSVVACLSLLLYQRVRQFNLWQQAVVVFVLVGVNQAVGQLLPDPGGRSSWGLMVLMPIVVSALLWPGVMILLRYLRRRYRIA